MTNSTSEREQRPPSLVEIRATLTTFKPETLGSALMHGYAVHLLSLLDSEAASGEPNLTERDKTRFLERGFAVVENAGHSLRLIKHDDARQAISIKWDDLPALRELITLALDDGPMVIGLDTSGQAAKNAATSMRDLCVEKVKAMRRSVVGITDTRLQDAILRRNTILGEAVIELEAVTLEQEQK